MLPGLDVTSKHLFFVNFAQFFCSIFTKEEKQLKIAWKFRVNRPVANFEEFAKVFKCHSGSSMNPKDKCSMW